MREMWRQEEGEEEGDRRQGQRRQGSLNHSIVAYINKETSVRGMWWRISLLPPFFM